ncbi:MAG: hypothetical protein COW58_11560 [Thalassolituus sp. CG17_big_fil_post_rev_8_21_14_2_50_53_8]|nr:MAG: hypothetical protein COW58_11560 [Thalassolituus sp. CG17_big_fil_post_rev_8_21_14_2_50_53_8]
MKLHPLASSISLLLAASLAACSGSSTSSSDEPSDNGSGGDGQAGEAVTVERVSLTGLAVKGTVIGAKAELFRLINGNIEEAAFATGATDLEGRYNLTATSEEAYNGPALVKISWQEGAEMICDASSGCGDYPVIPDDRNTNNPGSAAIDFGETFDLATDFEMSALLPSISTSSLEDNSYTANITSLTHIAAQYSAAQSDVNADLIRRLNNRVRQLFGLSADKVGAVDLLLTSPLDPTSAQNSDDPSGIAYGLITAALAELAGQRGESIQQVLSTFAQNFTANGGQLYWNGTDTGELNIAAILAAANAVAAANGNVPGTITTSLSNEKDSADSNSGVSNINPPEIDAGADLSATPNQAGVTLTGNLISGTNLTYQWTQVSGTPVSLNTPTALTTSFTAPQASGDLVFALRAKDAAGYDDIDRVTVKIRAAAGAAAALAGNYRIYIPNQMFSSSAFSNQQTEFDFDLNLVSGLSVTASASDPSAFSLNIKGSAESWRLENRYPYGSFFNGPGSAAQSVTDGQLVPQVDSENFTLDGKVDAQGVITINDPTSVEQDTDGQGNEVVRYDYSNILTFMPVDTGSYLALNMNHSEGFAAKADGSADTSQLRYRDFDVENLLLVKNSGNFSQDSFQNDYGVIVLSQATDETFAHALVSELQRWNITKDSGTPSVITATMESDPGLSGSGRVGSRYSHDIELSGGVYSESLGSFSVLSGEESPSNDPQTPASERQAIFAIDGSKSGQFRIPSSLSAALLPDGGNAIMEGIATPNGALFMSTLMGTTSKGSYNSTPVKTLVNERYIGLAIDNSTLIAADFTGKTYELRGVEYAVDANDRGSSANMIRGTLSFGSTPAAPVVTVNNQEVRLRNTNFTVVRSSEDYSSSDDPLAAEFGSASAIKLYDSETTLDGYVSANGKLVLLRLLNTTESDRGAHGFLIGRLIE